MDFTLCFRILRGAALAFAFVGPALGNQTPKIRLPTHMKLPLEELKKKGYDFNAVIP